MADKRGDGLAYSLTIYPEDEDYPRIFAITERDEKGPGVVGNLDAVLGELRHNKGLDLEDIVLYRNREGVWDEVVVGPHGIASREPIDGGPRTVTDAVWVSRGEDYPWWLPNEPVRTHSISVHDDVIALVDYDDGTGKSITNDAERVIDNLGRDGYDLARSSLIYRDTMGQWDELRVENGRFAGFRSLGGARDLSEALERVRRADPAQREAVSDGKWLNVVREMVASAPHRAPDREPGDGHDR